MRKFKYSDIHRNCTLEQWINQYNPIRLEVGKIYQQESESWCKKQYKILFVDDKIAIGISIHNTISDRYIGEYCLFYVDNGFKYNDMIQPSYRLVKEVNYTKKLINE